MRNICCWFLPVLFLQSVQGQLPNLKRFVNVDRTDHVMRNAEEGDDSINSFFQLEFDSNGDDVNDNDIEATLDLLKETYNNLILEYDDPYSRRMSEVGIELRFRRRLSNQDGRELQNLGLLFFLRVSGTCLGCPARSTFTFNQVVGRKLFSKDLKEGLPTEEELLEAYSDTITANSADTGGIVDVVDLKELDELPSGKGKGKGGSSKGSGAAKKSKRSGSAKSSGSKSASKAGSGSGSGKGGSSGSGKGGSGSGSGKGGSSGSGKGGSGSGSGKGGSSGSGKGGSGSGSGKGGSSGSGKGGSGSGSGSSKGGSGSGSGKGGSSGSGKGGSGSGSGSLKSKSKSGSGKSGSSGSGKGGSSGSGKGSSGSGKGGSGSGSSKGGKGGSGSGSASGQKKSYESGSSHKKFSKRRHL